MRVVQWDPVLNQNRSFPTIFSNKPKETTMNTAKTLWAAGLVIAGLGSWGVAAEVATDTSAKPAVLETGAASVTTTVEDINYDTRMLTLKTADGNTSTMQ